MVNLQGYRTGRISTTRARNTTAQIYKLLNINQMTPEEFSKRLHSKAKEVIAYSSNKFPAMAGNIALRFIDGNFRAQGFQGSSFQKWKKSKSKGTTLVKTGKLRSATHYTTQIGQVTIKNSMPYAKAHNEGLDEQVSVKAHTRNSYKKTKAGTGKFTKKGKERQKTISTKSSQSQVRAHTRNIKLPARPFIPTSSNPSPVLNKAITREMTKDLIKIIS